MTHPNSLIEHLESRIAPATLVGLTAKDVLITFDSALPTKILSSAKITGLAAGENLVSLDARPANGVLYGLTNKNTLYSVSPFSGVATLVTSGAAAFSLTGKTFELDFNPTVDRVRVVTDTDLNFRVNPRTGDIVDGDGVTAGTQPDTALAYDAADVRQGKNPTITAVAYDRNFQGSTLTTLFGIDTTFNTLVRDGGVDGTPSPNGGVLTTIGALGVNPKANVGFDIATDGTAYATMQVGSKTSLYTIDLTTGEAALVGRVGSGAVKLDAMTALPHEEVVVGVTASNFLISFRASEPALLLSKVAITGLSMGETIRGIDFRPATGELFGVTSGNQVVTIDRITGKAIARGSAVSGALFTAGLGYGVDFNPQADRLRLGNGSSDNLRFNPTTFLPVDSDGNSANGTQPDTDLAFIATDPNVGMIPDIAALAYDRNDVDGLTATTLFGIDILNSFLVRQGSVDSNASDVAGGGSPNGGLLTTLGSLGSGLDADQADFDISGDGRLGVGVALAVLQLDGESVSKLFTINLQSGLTNQPLGEATFIGRVAGGELITAMAIAPSSVQFTTTNTIVKEKTGTFAVIEVARTGGADAIATVVFDTSDDTATAGLDYTAVISQTLTFARGETLKRVMIPILGDNLAEFDESIHLQLTSASGTTVLGGTVDASVIITGKKLSL